MPDLSTLEEDLRIGSQEAYESVITGKDLKTLIEEAGAREESSCLSWIMVEVSFDQLVFLKIKSVPEREFINRSFKALWAVLIQNKDRSGEPQGLQVGHCATLGNQTF